MKGFELNCKGMGPCNFHQYMHPFDGSLEFKVVSKDAMKPQLLRNFCEFPSTQDGISSLHVYVMCIFAKVKFPSTYDGTSITTSLHVYVMDNRMLNKDSAKGTECVCSGAAEQPSQIARPQVQLLCRLGHCSLSKIIAQDWLLRKTMFLL